MHSGIGDAKDLSRFGIKPIVNLPSVGRNLSDHPLTPIVWPVNTTETIETLARDPVIAAKVLAEWRTNRTGPLVDTVFNQIGWLRVKNSEKTFQKYGDPSAGPLAPHFGLLFQVFSLFSPNNLLTNSWFYRTVSQVKNLLQETTSSFQLWYWSRLLVSPLRSIF